MPTCGVERACNGKELFDEVLLGVIGGSIGDVGIGTLACFGCTGWAAEAAA